MQYTLDLNIKVGGVKIPTGKNSNNLAITFDNLWSFTPHTSAIAIQICQNTALHAIKGYLLISTEEHLHSAACMLPVKEHNELHSKQFLLGYFRRTIRRLDYRRS